MTFTSLWWHSAWCKAKLQSVVAASWLVMVSHCRRCPLLQGHIQLWKLWPSGSQHVGLEWTLQAQRKRPGCALRKRPASLECGETLAWWDLVLCWWDFGNTEFFFNTINFACRCTTYCWILQVSFQQHTPTLLVLQLNGNGVAAKHNLKRWLEWGIVLISILSDHAVVKVFIPGCFVLPCELHEHALHCLVPALVKAIRLLEEKVVQYKTLRLGYIPVLTELPVRGW